MTTTEIFTESHEGIFGTETQYSFNVIASNSGLTINTHTAIVEDSGDEAIVYFTDIENVSEEYVFKNIDTAHLFAKNELLKIKNINY